MDAKVLSAEEIRGFTPAQIKEAELEIRRAIMDSRMQLFNDSKFSGGRRILKKNLARLLTVKAAGLKK